MIINSEKSKSTLACLRLLILTKYGSGINEHA